MGDQATGLGAGGGSKGDVQISSSSVRVDKRQWWKMTGFGREYHGFDLEP